LIIAPVFPAEASDVRLFTSGIFDTIDIADEAGAVIVGNGMLAGPEDKGCPSQEALLKHPKRAARNSNGRTFGDVVN
jgi:hypothetical protein